jgi:sulfur carrier protein ThiS
MIITVKLYGTHRQLFPEYDSQRGIEIDIQDGATVKDLLFQLGILPKGSAIVEMDGRIVKADATLDNAVCVKLFNVISGG